MHKYMDLKGLTDTNQNKQNTAKTRKRMKHICGVLTTHTHTTV